MVKETILREISHNKGRTGMKTTGKKIEVRFYETADFELSPNEIEIACTDLEQ
jgi:hypothetical protein